MKKEAFWQLVQNLYGGSQVPLTRENLIRCSGVSSSRVDEWLADLLSENKLEAVFSGDVLLQYRLVGQIRPSGGSHSLVQCMQCLRYTLPGGVCMHCKGLLGDLVDLKESQHAAFVVPERQPVSIESDLTPSRLAKTSGVIKTPNGGIAAVLGQTILNEMKQQQQQTQEPGKKSLVASGALGLLGPLGWFYSGSFKEVIPASLLFLLALKIIPTVFWWALLFPLIPFSMVVGVLYAWKYNQTLDRHSLVIDRLIDGKKKQDKEIPDGS